MYTTWLETAALRSRTIASKITSQPATILCKLFSLAETAITNVPGIGWG